MRTTSAAQAVLTVMLGNIEEYAVIYRDTAQELELIVNTMLQDGWQPYGQIVMWWGGAALLQVMVRFAKVEV